MALTKAQFLRGRESKNGLAGYLGAHLRGWGTVDIASGATSATVTDTEIATGDIIVASVLTKGTNACYVVDTSITDATSFDIDVNTDPGEGGVTIAYVILRA